MDKNVEAIATEFLKGTEGFKLIKLENTKTM